MMDFVDHVLKEQFIINQEEFVLLFVLMVLSGQSLIKNVYVHQINLMLVEFVLNVQEANYLIQQFKDVNQFVILDMYTILELINADLNVAYFNLILTI